MTIDLALSIISLAIATFALGFTIGIHIGMKE